MVGDAEGNQILSFTFHLSPIYICIYKYILCILLIITFMILLIDIVSFARIKKNFRFEIF